MPKLGFGDGPRYWDQRYAKEPKPYDWLQDFTNLRDILDKYLEGDQSRQLLHIGCGNSLLPEHMYDYGYKRIVNVDNSSVVIKQMHERNKDIRPELQWVVEDATALTFADATFDAVLDKSVLDTFACGDDADGVVAKYLKQVERVLTKSGIYISVNFGTPETRACHLKAPHLSFAVETVTIPVNYDEDMHCHYVYICRKHSEAMHSNIRTKGKVASFDRRRGFGFIRPESGGALLFVHWEQIVSSDEWPALEADMDVEYFVGVDKQSRAIASKVTLPGGQYVCVPRITAELSPFTYSGCVLSFSCRSGYGFIRTDENVEWPVSLAAGSKIYVSREDIVLPEGGMDSRRNLEQGQRVSFRVRQRDSEETQGGAEAVGAAEVKVVHAHSPVVVRPRGPGVQKTITKHGGA